MLNLHISPPLSTEGAKGTLADMKAPRMTECGPTQGQPNEAICKILCGFPVVPSPSCLGAGAHQILETRHNFLSDTTSLFERSGHVPLHSDRRLSPSDIT